MKTILLKFVGPLQSWGSSSHFEIRRTDHYPTKSAVLGLIAASFGYRRGDQDLPICLNKLNGLDFAVRVDQAGNMRRDYHTAKKYKANGMLDRTYVTNRYYLEDACVLASLSHKNDTFVDGVEYALRHPYFQQYMGRRSNPIPPDFILLCQSTSDPLEIIEKYPWQAAQWYRKKHIWYGKKDEKMQLEIYADSDLVKKNTAIPFIKRDRAISFSPEERKFGTRYITRFTVPVEDLDDSDVIETNFDESSDIDFWKAVKE